MSIKTEWQLPRLRLHWLKSGTKSESLDSVSGKRADLRKILISFLRRLSILVLGIFLNSTLFLGAVGVVNRRMRLIDTIFLVYPATPEYALAYFFEWHIPSLAWRPHICGLFKQGGRWGIMFAITSTEEQFRQKEKKPDLAALVGEIERLRSLIGANQATYSGILPGVLKVMRLRDQSPENSVTVRAVLQAECQVRSTLALEPNTPIVVLGGRGFIGRSVVEELLALGRVVYSVDMYTGEIWPSHLEGTPVIVINVTKKAAITDYTPLFWKEVVLLNEVYPEPSDEELQTLRDKQCSAFHIVGVVASAYPAFPRAYKGGIPCCAAMNLSDLEVITKDLL